MFNLRTLLPLSLALAVTACNGKDKDTDGDETDTETEETAETGEPDPFFRPAQAGILYYGAVNADGELSAFTIEGNEIQPAVEITLTDAAGTECVLVYELDLVALADYLGSGEPDTDVEDTDTDAAVVAALTDEGEDFYDWLEGQGQVIGFALATGLYTPLISQGCELDPADWTDDPHSSFLGGQWEYGFYAGVPTLAEDALDEAGVTLEEYYGEDFDLENAVGGVVRIPDGFFGPGSDREFGALGLAGEVDEDMEVQSDSEGLLVPIAAEDLVVEGVMQPSYWQLQPTFGIVFN